MDSTLIVVNCGSSSVKLALYGLPDCTPRASAVAERLHTEQALLKVDGSHHDLPESADHQTAIEAAIEVLRQANALTRTPSGIGHRVVHGGEAFTGSVRIDDSVMASISECAALAPLHNPANLEGIQAMRALYPGVPQVAVFDTAFHQSLPRYAFLYGLPYELYEQQGVRRYGFHGTSHRCMLQRTAQILGKPEAETHLISAHLGNGCSITAIRNGHSVDTSMGLTPLEGLVMGTRSGDIDPGLFDFFLNRGYAPETINHMLNRESGLLGVSGVSNDMRTLLEAAESGHERAGLAVDIFCFRLARYIGAMMASMSQLDALVFTGGIGENSAPVRAATIEHLRLLGFMIEESANQCHGSGHGGAIQAQGSHRILVIPTDEEGVIASDTHALISAP